MRRNGFTLIELLAVIVILAIIALIATPIILNIIENAREESNKRSIELYASAVKNALLVHEMNGTGEAVGDFTAIDAYTLKNDEDITLKLDYTGNEVLCDTIKIYEDGSFYLAGCKVNGEEVEYAYGTKEEEKPCTYVDEDSSGTINLSDVVTCGTESFYVMENDENNITMLSMYNLNVGDSVYTDGTIGIQNENVVGGQPETSIKTYGSIYFSSNDYWIDLVSLKLLVDTNYAQEGRSYPYVYGDYKDANGNQQNIIYPYVEAYETYLKENGVSSASATLISYEQAESLGCSGSSCTSAPSWLHSTAYWFGSAYGNDNLIFHIAIFDDGSFFLGSSDDVNGFGYCYYGSCGVRPVITISTSEIQ